MSRFRAIPALAIMAAASMAASAAAPAPWCVDARHSGTSPFYPTKPFTSQKKKRKQRRRGRH